MKTFSRAPEKFYTLPVVVLCLYVYLSTWQAPLSMGFSKQGCWNESPRPPPRDLLNTGLQPVSLTLHLLCLLHWQEGSLPLVPQGKPCIPYTWGKLLYTNYTLIKLILKSVNKTEIKYRQTKNSIILFLKIFSQSGLLCIFFFFSIYFYQLEANQFTIPQWVLSYIDMNQPWICMYSPS